LSFSFFFSGFNGQFLGANHPVLIETVMGRLMDAANRFSPGLPFRKAERKY
jgi:hypothetical protein